MADASSRTLAWRELHWRRPLDPLAVLSCLRQWAADQRSPRVMLEARATPGRVRYLVGSHPSALHDVLVPLRLIGATAIKVDGVREPVTAAGHLRASTRHRPLRSDQPDGVVRAILGALTDVRKDEVSVLQIVLGPRRIPLAVPNQSPSSVIAPWWQVAWRGDGGQIDGEKRSALRTKVGDHGFAATMRLGVCAASADRRRRLILGILAAIRTSEASGVQLRLVHDRASHVNDASPPCRWPLRLGVAELTALTGWPLGDDDLPGQPAAHPRLLPPAPGTTGKTRIIGDATASTAGVHLALPASQALHHLHVIGPTGAGKSTMLASLICQDIAAGHGVIVIEPKGDLVDDVLGQIPEHRIDDVVILDPSDPAPVGLNPLDGRGRRPELVADSVLAIFKQLYGAAIGPRSQDILYASLLTLARRPDASLVMLPLLFANPGFRRSLTAGIDDPLFLDGFWAGFEAWSDAERAAATAPAMNKLRPLLRPGVRGVLGQRQPRFDIARVFTQQKILLVPLRRGVIGAEAAGLLGSLVMASVWGAIQAQAAVPAQRRRPVMVYVDEVQDYLHLGTDLGDALAQARGYGAGFTLSHQLLDQLPRDMRSAVLANARSRICFQLPPGDAVLLAKGHPELTAADLSALGQYEIYASLFAHGRVQPYASGRTLAPPKAIRRPDEVRRRSRDRYGRPLDQIEAGFADLLDTSDLTQSAPGRRRRQP